MLLRIYYSQRIVLMLLVDFIVKTKRLCSRSTPLNPAIVALKEIVTEFKTANQLDIVNTIFVHDGDSNSLRTYIEKEDDPYGSYLYDKEGIIIQDHKTRFQSMTNNRHRNDNITHTLLKWLKHSTGTQVFGFFVSTKMPMPLQICYRR